MAALPTIDQLRERAALQTRTEAPADGGGTTEAYKTVRSAWANVEAISGGRYIAGQQTEQIATHRIQVRYFAAYKTITYVDWSGTKLIVRSTRLMDVTRQFVEYLCEELH